MPRFREFNLATDGSANSLESADEKTVMRHSLIGNAD
jgi:hypothetical protein